ncbi:MAG: porin [Proteobacteria bacterium]|nr:porin [Pseudomonadota bacterium]
MGLRWRIAVAAVAAASIAGPAQAGVLDDWAADAPSAQLGDWTASLGADLSGAAFASHQDGGIGQAGVQAFAVFSPSLSRSFPNGWEIGAKASLLAWHDNHSGDNYGNDVFELAYLYVQSPYGRIAAGQQNGVAYDLAVAAPVVDGPAAINDSNVTFFEDPATGLAFIGLFNLRTGVFTSANQAKLSYISPRWTGLQFGVSYTPYQTKAVLPWTMTGHHVPDRVADIVEGNLNYTAQFGAWSVQASTSFGTARDAARTPGHANVWDWGAGFEADYAFDDQGKLSLGAAYRVSNAYTFNVQQAFSSGTTGNLDLGAVWSKGDWSAGVEYETGIADAVPGAPRLREWGWNPSLAYSANTNLQITLGWQYLHFGQSSGLFYNGKSGVGMQAFYLHGEFKL